MNTKQLELALNTLIRASNAVGQYDALKHRITDIALHEQAAKAQQLVTELTLQILVEFGASQPATKQMEMQ